MNKSLKVIALVLLLVAMVSAGAFAQSSSIDVGGGLVANLYPSTGDAIFDALIFLFGLRAGAHLPSGGARWHKGRGSIGMDDPIPAG